MTHRLRTNTLALIVAGAALALAACDKDKQDDAETPAADELAQPATDEPAQPATDEPVQPAADLTPAEGDHVTVVADHTDKAKGKVDVVFHRFAVTEAEFDPANLEGGTATLVVDLASLKTDSEKRDKHLRSEDYLEVTAYPNATVTISDVKKKAGADKAYTAKADVEVHGVTVAWPVTFEVIEETDAAMIVEGELAFKRSDIGVGAATGEDDPVADEMAVKVRLTLPKPA
jgi:polyisoprenoid-binding protein YceI